ncbi:MAG: Mrp/NBP35 family ATP-binding protein [Verrucomicrobiota bacterium]
MDKLLLIEELKNVKYPGFSRDIVSFGLVKELFVEDGEVRVEVKITTSDSAVVEKIEKDIRHQLSSMDGVNDVSVNMSVTAPAHSAAQAGGDQQPPQQSIPGVKHIIAIASGKGGVGKSTVSANLAVALHEQGLKTGLCDCDLYGPSMGLMFDVDERPTMAGEDRINPIDKNGLKLMSMGFLVDDDSPVILRGPMVTRYIQQFLRHVEWGELDVLVLDLPPGTGDIQLTIVQTVALTGSVVVTTPQEVALIDARKAIQMFAKVNVKVLGLIENMSYFESPSDAQKYYIFGEGGGRKEAERMNVDLLAEVPIDMATRAAADEGHPIVWRDPHSSATQAFKAAATALSLVLA